MKRFAILAMFVALTGAFLSSCTKEDVEQDNTAQNVALLKDGTWTISHVDVNYFDYQGNPTGTERVQFGEGEEGGICTFKYADALWTMDDNGEIFEAAYTVDKDIITTEGGGTWGIRRIEDTELEIVLRGEVSNPCDYSQSGAVYTLTRQAQR